jgi:RNA polymerase sigma factor (sigma-70 family)
LATFTHAAAAVADVIATRREQLLERVRGHNRRRAFEAEDVLHGAIQRALEHAGQLRDPARAEAWLGRIVRNTLLDELRRPENAALVDEQALPPPQDEAPQCGCVLHQVEQMRPAQAEILRRVVVEGVPVTRVAAELGITANSAMVRLHRARAALAERLRLHCGTTNVRACNDCGCEERGCCAASSSPANSARAKEGPRKRA